MAAVVSVALGVGVVVLVNSLYAAARRTVIDEVVNRWLGSAHLSIHPSGAHWGSLDESIVDRVRQLPGVQYTAARAQRRMLLVDTTDTNSQTEPPVLWVDAIGIDPDHDRPFRKLPLLTAG